MFWLMMFLLSLVYFLAGSRALGEVIARGFLFALVWYGYEWYKKHSDATK